MGIWQEETTITHKPIISDVLQDVSFLNASCPGVFIKNSDIGMLVAKGDSVGHIVDPLTGRILDEVTSPVDGWIFTIREYPMVSEGSLMGRILARHVYDRGGEQQ